MNDYSTEMILMMLKRIEMTERTLNQRYKLPSVLIFRYRKIYV